MIAKHSVNGQIVGAILGAWTVVVLALKYGTPGWTKLDKICLGGAVLGIVLWQIFSSPTVGMLTSLSVVFLGSFPTFKSAYQDPSKEDKTAWTIYWISCVVAVIAIPAWTPEDAAQPLTFALIESIMMWLLWFRKDTGTRTDHLNYHELRERQLYRDHVDHRPPWQSREDAERQLERSGLRPKR
jgi:hypothetical protein